MFMPIHLPFFYLFCTFFFSSAYLSFLSFLFLFSPVVSSDDSSFSISPRYTSLLLSSHIFIIHSFPFLFSPLLCSALFSSSFTSSTLSSYLFSPHFTFLSFPSFPFSFCFSSHLAPPFLSFSFPFLSLSHSSVPFLSLPSSSFSTLIFSLQLECLSVCRGRVCVTGCPTVLMGRMN